MKTGIEKVNETGADSKALDAAARKMPVIAWGLLFRAGGCLACTHPAGGRVFKIILHLLGGAAPGMGVGSRVRDNCATAAVGV